MKIYFSILVYFLYKYNNVKIKYKNSNVFFFKSQFLMH